ncbi:hypothetical protein UU9_07636 [Rhodanobacter fulvus Jip2]|uniref:VWA domain-containing protein n=1 Tax=Rhodanobacter fulvus Jip2 TaxID=1163408 RepID=I4VS79_9GAMM|nr:hypothetical protein [Rhodanobacter fulvus]EIL90070.1 hypothetical protein UU9_07636 [Rhodanobacter fulvus Jip2]
MTRHFLVALVFALVLGIAPFIARAEPMQQAFLVQNSGWMEPFYADPGSQFKPLVSAVVATVSRPGDRLTVAAFNQGGQGNVSPKLLYNGGDPAQVARVLGPLQPARKASGALADTDFREAILATITGPFQAKPGILWIFTNNRNSPGNDPDTAKRNLEFYQLVHLDPSITRSLAFPLRMRVRGAHYSASGMMVYALAYGEPAAARLEQMVNDGTLRRVFTTAPARLKPLDRDAVRIVPRGVSNSANVTAMLATDGRTLVFDIGASDEVTRIGLTAALENLFYPYQITSADVGARLIAGDNKFAVTVLPQAITSLAPGAEAEVTLDLPVPQEHIPSPWSFAAIKAMGKEVLVPARVEITLDHQQLRIADAFRSNLARLFPGDPLADVFVPPQAIEASTAEVPVLFRVRYPLLPVVLLMSAILLLIVAIACLTWLAGRTARFEIMIDGYSRKVGLKAFATLNLNDPDGVYAGRIKRGLGAPRVIDTVPGHAVSVRKP